MEKTLRELAEAVDDTFLVHQQCVHKWMGADDALREAKIECEILDASLAHREAKRTFAAEAGIREDMVNIVIARLLTDALDAERAAVLEEVREWLEEYRNAEKDAADKWDSYEMNRAYGIEDTLEAFTSRFLAGKEGA